MFSPEGPSLRELAVQALSSVERGYDLLAPKFDHTPFRTPAAVLDAVGSALVRADARALPFAPAFDLVVSFGAFGHFLPRELPGLFAQVRSVLRPGGCFAFPLVAPPRPGSLGYWTLLGFDTVMRVRNALWRPEFVMYYRAFRLGDVRRELEAAGFGVELQPLPEFGRRPDGSPRVRLVMARLPG
ncbi:class I SAM-dependent methyltransferase [Streptomyces sp. NRRL S-146]|uniref:class I SAM-dependent methyltransferase n=1 Tax=Streptomyces sp. NRRL S-146 TaxID=1463884 RepID=UPI0004C537DE|nr:class I SAM-dependent methyltransferase [Streptomyces sp. NRRL S-146]